MHCLRKPGSAFAVCDKGEVECITIKWTDVTLMMVMIACLRNVIVIAAEVLPDRQDLKGRLGRKALRERQAPVEYQAFRESPAPVERPDLRERPAPVGRPDLRDQWGLRGSQVLKGFREYRDRRGPRETPVLQAPPAFRARPVPPARRNHIPMIYLPHLLILLPYTGMQR